MKIVICGAGQVGYTIARQLADEGNDITIVDKDEQLIQQISDTLEVRTIVGHASHPAVLEQAGLSDAEMLIAVTYSDEINMVACQVAHSLFNVPTRIARIRNQNYLNPKWKDLYRIDHLPIDVIISPEREVAEAVVRRLHVPGATDMVPFFGGHVKVIAVLLELGSPVINLPVHVVRQKMRDLKIGIVGVAKNNQFIIPHDNTILSPGDEVYFVADNASINAAMEIFGHREKEARRIVILGGGNIGLFIAEKLEKEDEGTQIKIIEMDRKRAKYIDGMLEHSMVINGNGLDHEILREVNINMTETIIAVTNDDEVNVLGSLLAKRYGCQRSVTLINNMTYIPLLGNLGIDVVVNPRETTVSSILQHIRRGKISNVHSIMDGQAEIIEAEAVETSSLIGKSMDSLGLKKGVLIGAILRHGEIIIPESDTAIQQDDRVIILSMAKMVKKIEKIFSVSLEFF